MNENKFVHSMKFIKDCLGGYHYSYLRNMQPNNEESSNDNKAKYIYD